MSEGCVGNQDITQPSRQSGLTVQLRIHHGNVHHRFAERNMPGFRPVPKSPDADAAGSAHVAHHHPTSTRPPLSSASTSVDIPTSDAALSNASSRSTYPDTRSSLSPNSSPRWRFNAAWTRRRQDRHDDSDSSSRGPDGLRLVHSSPEPLIDIIFVHGLRGGSIKTWRKGNDPQFFWPQYWLPAERGFYHVNIHSFGYVSDWASTKSSILNVHDFGQSLLEGMRNSPYIRDNGSGPIILVGHSMGGLVIKKAYILAQVVSDLRSRIQCIFFLATPHKGSDYAATLNNILTVTGVLSSRDYIRDLTSGSTSAQLINEDFGRCAHQLHIYSFYETLRTSLGVSSTMIVEKDSAVLGPGFKNERVQYLDANHRNVCKFDSPDDPNYHTVRDALSGAVQDVLTGITDAKEEEKQAQMSALKSYLSISDRPDEVFQKTDGSCQWIDERDEFQSWRDCTNELPDERNPDDQAKNPSIIWLHAKPGTGKTILASHVASELRDHQLECAQYYFHAGSKVSRSLSDCLRSIAYQMAKSNTAVREKLTQMRNEGSTFDLDYDGTIWTKLFRRGVFQARIYTPQYWVLDALDECTKYQDFLTMLKGEKPNFPLRIFLTSRTLPDMARIHRPLQASMSLRSLQIPTESSMHDIECYIQSRTENLPLDESSDRIELARKILVRSNASFLWVRLVLDELEHVYSSASILKVIEGIPEGMMPYYQRTVSSMAENKREKHIAKAVLLWVVTSSRRLTVAELSQALRLDIKEELPSAKSAVEGLCGQLVSVDKDTDMIDVVHPTVREFLHSEAAGEFHISKALAHKRIASTCLRLLSGRDLHPPRGRRGSTQVRSEEPPLLDYAITQFSEHIYGASSETDDLLLSLDLFFKINILAWVEWLALRGDLYCLIRTSRNLKAYLARRAKYHSPLSAQVRNVDSWALDLTRLVTKFGTALLQNPASIFFLVPPLCPTQSAVYKQFGRRADGLALLGFRNTTWDDCIASMAFGQDSPLTASCGESLIAIGMASGDIPLYNQQSCQKSGVLRTKWPIDLVHFAGDFVVICTVKNLILQSTEGQVIWETRLRSRCILLASTDSLIYAVSQHGHLLKWSRTDGVLQEDQSFEYRNHNVETDYNRLTDRAPLVASISPDMEMLALGYRGGTVCLWDLQQSGNFIGWARSENDNLPAKILFNPNPNIGMLLVLYTDHDLALFETWAGSLIHSAKPMQASGVVSASCSPDGRTFATCDSLMNLQIWDFESLSLLYYVKTPYSSFRILNFTSDGSSIIDMSDFGMRIWSPAALTRKNVEEDASTSDDAVHFSATEGQYEPLRSARMTALHPHPSLPIVFVGNHVGQVVAYSTKTGQQVSILYTHPQKESVTQLAVSQNDLVASSDASGMILAWRLHNIKQLTALEGDSSVLRVRSREPVKQICFSVHDNFLLTSSATSTTVYSMKDGSCIGSMDLGSQGRTPIWRWIPVLGATQDQQFMLIEDRTIKTYSASTFPSQTETFSFHLRYELQEHDLETAIRSAVLHEETQTLVMEVSHDTRYASSTTTFLFKLGQACSLSSPNDRSEPVYLNGIPLHPCEYFIGFDRRLKPEAFVFLDHNSWLSSITLDSLESKRYTRHFFVPNEYVSSMHAEYHVVRPVATAEDDVVFCLYGELVIVKNGLQFQYEKGFEARLIRSPNTP
ncbi:hypothetical protein PG989_005485 [Apiospora arundinis]|uniref:GPI inositol-deacylase n=1 Tax=Apiospora arundinis TaxID=335852 RepID=A0ABR2IUR1_9PEZI